MPIVFACTAEKLLSHSVHLGFKIAWNILKNVLGRCYKNQKSPFQARSQDLAIWV